MRLDLQLDLLPRRRWPVPGVLLAVLGLGLLLWQGERSLQAARDLQQHRAGLAALERAGQVRPRAAMSREDIQRHEQMLAVSQYLALPWDDLLAVFERLSRDGVTLTRLRPDATTGRVELGARAAGAEAAGRYLQALRSEPLLGQVQLTRHDTPTEAAGNGLELTVSATWRASPAASAASTPSPKSASALSRRPS